MRTRRWAPSGVLGALALSLGLSAPAWAIWEGIDPIQPIMPRWTWEGIELQEDLRDLTPEQAIRLERVPDAQKDEALQSILREARGSMRSNAALQERMQRMPQSPDVETPDKSIREQPQETSPDERPQGQPEPQDQDQDQANPEEHSLSHDAVPAGFDGQTAAADDADDAYAEGEHRQRVEVEIKPVPKSQQAPPPGETPVVADDPIDEASTHIGMAHSSVMAEDWEAAKSHLRQANEALDQIVVRGDRNAERYMERLKGEIRNTEKAIDSRAKDLDDRLENLQTTVRHLKPEER